MTWEGNVFCWHHCICQPLYYGSLVCTLMNMPAQVQHSWFQRLNNARTWALSPAWLWSSPCTGSFLRLHLEANCSCSPRFLLFHVSPVINWVSTSDSSIQASLHLIGCVWVTWLSLGQSLWPVNTMLWLSPSESNALSRVSGIKHHRECHMGREEWVPQRNLGCSYEGKVATGEPK